MLLVDADGTPIGPVVTLDNIVAANIQGQTYLMVIQDATWYRQHLYYTSTDCTGQAYATLLWSPTLERHTAVSGPANTLYVSSPFPPRQTIDARSRSLDGCQAFTLTEVMFAVSSTGINLDTLYTPPFHIELP